MSQYISGAAAKLIGQDTPEMAAASRYPGYQHALRKRLLVEAVFYVLKNVSVILHATQMESTPEPFLPTPMGRLYQQTRRTTIYQDRFGCCD